jgi:hypothetical protein
MAKDNITKLPRKPRAKGKEAGVEEAEAIQSERAGARHAKAPEVAKIADTLIPSPGLGLKTLEGKKIAYLFSSAKTIGCNGFVATRIFPAWARVFGKFDFLIVVSKFQWDQADERMRQAAIAHALSHAGYSEKGVPERADHDYEDFGLVAKRFGAWSEGGRLVAKQLRLLDDERDTFARVEARAEGIVTAPNGNGHQQAAD